MTREGSIVPDLYIGQRVGTITDAPAAWPGAFSAPAGSIGTIVGGIDAFGCFGVVLDGDPDALPASYHPDELRARP